YLGAELVRCTLRVGRRSTSWSTRGHGDRAPGRPGPGPAPVGARSGRPAGVPVGSPSRSLFPLPSELVPACRARTVHATSSAPRYELVDAGGARASPRVGGGVAAPPVVGEWTRRGARVSPGGRAGAPSA